MASCIVRAVKVPSHPKGYASALISRPSELSRHRFDPVSSRRCVASSRPAKARWLWPCDPTAIPASASCLTWSKPMKSLHPSALESIGTSACSSSCARNHGSSSIAPSRNERTTVVMAMACCWPPEVGDDGINVSRPTVQGEPRNIRSLKHTGNVVPPGQSRCVEKPSCDEERCRHAMLAEDRQRRLAVISITIVERDQGYRFSSVWRDAGAHALIGSNVEQSIQTQNVKPRGQESNLGLKRVRRGRDHRVVVGVGGAPRYGDR